MKNMNNLYLDIQNKMDDAVSKNLWNNIVSNMPGDKFHILYNHVWVFIEDCIDGNIKIPIIQTLIK